MHDSSPVRTHRRSVAAIAAALLAVAAVAASPAHGAASTVDPRAATIDVTQPTAAWSESQPMTGAAPARRDAVCTAQDALTHPCDDFTLTIDRGDDENTQVDLAVTPNGSNTMSIAVYPPGCRSDPSQTACYTLYGSTATLLSPANGEYLIRMSCDVCANATYDATATLSAIKGFSLPDAGDQSYGWGVQQLTSEPTTPSGEPGIWINKLGHVIVNTFGPTVWISTDDGATFGDPVIDVDPICSSESGDADAVVSDDDTYYADNLCVAGPTNLSYSSTDAGQTWGGGAGGLPELPGAATDSDRQWYALDPSNPAVLYFSYHDFEGPNIWVNKSVDHGQTWLQQVPITLGAPNFIDTGVGNTSARPLVDPTDPNTVIVFYTSNDAQKSALAPPTNEDFDLTQIYMARSTDGGLTWSNTKLFDAGTSDGNDNTIAHEFSSSTIDAAGNAYVVFSERLGSGQETHIEFFAVPKGSISPVHPVQVDQAGLGANVFPWIAAGDPGRVDVTWYGSPSTDNDDPSSQWSEMFAQTLNGLDAAPTFAQSRVSGDKPMHNADICLAGTLCLVTGGNRDLADFQMIAVDPCGMAQLVWTDDSSGTGYTMHARQTGGASVRPTACAAVPPGNGGSGGESGGSAGGGGGGGTGSGGGSAATGRSNRGAQIATAVLALGLGGLWARRRLFRR